MDINASGDHFNMRMEKIFESMDQSTFLRIIDDILLQGTSEEEVISLLDKVLALCKKHNIVVSLQKFEKFETQ